MIRKHKIGLGRPQKQRLGLAAAFAQGDSKSQSTATHRILREQFWLSRPAPTTALVHEFSASGAETAPHELRSKKND